MSVERIFALSLLLAAVGAQAARAEGPAFGPYRAYYGQLHAHTSQSDGKLEPRDAYAMARVRGLDFYSVTDHLEQLMKRHLWRDAMDQADASDDPGLFVALPGFEWGGSPTRHGWMNHLNMIGSEEEPSVWTLLGLGKFFQALLRAPGTPPPVGQFNHPYYNRFGRYGINDWNHFEYVPSAAARMRLMNINPHTGCDEKAGYIPALDNGWHLSPEADEDNHGDSWASTSRRTGAWSTALTRAALLEAMGANRTFYSDLPGASIMLTADGSAVMGQSVGISGIHTLEVEIQLPAGAPAPVRLEIVTQGGSVAYRQDGQIPATSTIGPWVLRHPYYYARVLLPGDLRLISAPIFTAN